MTIPRDADSLEIRPLTRPEETEWCARLMLSSEPWITLKRTYEELLRAVEEPPREPYIAYLGGAPVGFLILNMAGPFPGYIQTVGVAPENRSSGIGRRLMEFAEQRIFRESPNAFLLVSSFNPRARRLYERLGYEVVGEFKDYVVRGHSEILMRKTLGPLREFTAGGAGHRFL